MEKFVSLETYLHKEASGNDGYWISHDKMNEFIGLVMMYFDKKIEELKDEFLSTKKPIPKRKMFDTLKNWWYNAIMGSRNVKNPYYHRNVLGHYGTVKEMSLEQYHFFANESEKIEALLVEQKKYYIEDLIDNWASEFKKELENHVRNYLRKFYRPVEPTGKTRISQPRTVEPTTKRIPKVRNKLIIRDSDAEKNSGEVAAGVQPKKSENEESGTQSEFIGTCPTSIEAEKLSPKLKTILAKICNGIKILEDETNVEFADKTLGDTQKQNLKEQEKMFAYMFNVSFYQKMVENQNVIQDVFKKLNDYLSSRSEINLQKLTNAFNTALGDSSMDEWNLDLPSDWTNLNFKNTTLYERTLECLDKLRNRS